ncbi:MAG: flippase-like domain-containing protein [Kiritimatiellaeota bacterium]|nr:flippase-like domain-containing protein [Kiritimatiellota bacterium]
MKRRWLSWGGTLVGFGLLAWVFVRLAMTQKLADLGKAFETAWQHPGWLAAAMAVFAGSLACGVARWMILLRALSIPMQTGRAIRLYVVGHFFNAVVPGATGGDAVKAAYAATDHATQRPEAVASVVTERIIGFMALAAAVILVMVGASELFDGTVAQTLGIAFSTAVLLGGAAIFCVDWEAWLWRRKASPTGWLLAVARWVRAVRAYARKPSVFWSVFAISFFNHVLTALCAGVLAFSLGLSAHLLDVMCVMVMVTAVSALAMTPGGAGVREALAIVLLRNLGIGEAEAVAVSLLMYAVILAWAFVGGIVWMTMLWGGRMKNEE